MASGCTGGRTARGRSQLDENPSNQATLSLCSPPKAAGRSELGNDVVLEVAQRCQGAEDALRAAELSGPPFAEVDVAGWEAEGDLDTFSSGGKMVLKSGSGCFVSCRHRREPRC